jgi:hypothetical protein
MEGHTPRHTIDVNKVFKTNPAFVAALHLADIVLETFQRGHAAFVHNHGIAQQADGRVADDAPVLNVQTGNAHAAGDPEHFAHFAMAEDMLTICTRRPSRPISSSNFRTYSTRCLALTLPSR